MKGIDSYRDLHPIYGDHSEFSQLPLSQFISQKDPLYINSQPYFNLFSTIISLYFVNRYYIIYFVLQI